MKNLLIINPKKQLESIHLQSNIQCLFKIKIGESPNFKQESEKP